jgi:hypothetical protein
LRGEHCGSARLTDKASTGSGAFSQWRGNFFATKLFMMGISLVWGIGLRAGLKKPAVLRRMSWSRRVIALATAYAIALSSLLASFGAAQVTAEAFAQPGGVLCHNTAADQPASHDGTQGKICVDDCCLGCDHTGDLAAASRSFCAPAIQHRACRDADELYPRSQSRLTLSSLASASSGRVKPSGPNGRMFLAPDGEVSCSAFQAARAYARC